MQTEKQVRECVFEEYATWSECTAIANWRADVRNAGAVAPVDEVLALIKAAPGCIVKHGTDADRKEFAALAMAVSAGVPISDIELVEQRWVTPKVAQAIKTGGLFKR